MKTLLVTVMIALAASSFGASACQKCKDVGFWFEYETCGVCRGTGMVSRRHDVETRGRLRCPKCRAIGNKLGKVKVKRYCDCQIGKAKKERDEKPRKMTLR